MKVKKFAEMVMLSGHVVEPDKLKCVVEYGSLLMLVDIFLNIVSSDGIHNYHSSSAVVGAKIFYVVVSRAAEVGLARRWKNHSKHSFLSDRNDRANKLCSSCPKNNLVAKNF